MFLVLCSCDGNALLHMKITFIHWFGWTVVTMLASNMGSGKPWQFLYVNILLYLQCSLFMALCLVKYL